MRRLTRNADTRSLFPSPFDTLILTHFPNTVNRISKRICDFFIIFCPFFGQFDQLTLTYNKIDSPLLSNFDDIGRTTYPLLLRPLLFPTLFAFPAFSALVLLSVFPLSFSCRRFFRSVLFCSAFSPSALVPRAPASSARGTLSRLRDPPPLSNALLCFIAYTKSRRGSPKGEPRRDLLVPLPPFFSCERTFFFRIPHRLIIEKRSYLPSWRSTISTISLMRSRSSVL